MGPSDFDWEYLEYIDILGTGGCLLFGTDGVFLVNNGTFYNI